MWIHLRRWKVIEHQTSFHHDKGQGNRKSQANRCCVNLQVSFWSCYLAVKLIIYLASASKESRKKRFKKWMNPKQVYARGLKVFSICCSNVKNYNPVLSLSALIFWFDHPFHAFLFVSPFCFNKHAFHYPTPASLFSSSFSLLLPLFLCPFHLWQSVFFSF